MPILLQAFDYTDDQALHRRMAHRQQHLELLKQNKDHKLVILASAILNEHKNMCGSIVIFNLDTPEEVENILKEEPYLIHRVWESYTLTPIAIPPLFLVEGSE